MSNAPASALPREVELGLNKESIVVKPASPEQQLQPMSRINFGKVYNVEWNIKVMDVGTIEGDSYRLLRTYFFNTFVPGL